MENRANGHFVSHEAGTATQLTGASPARPHHFDPKSLRSTGGARPRLLVVDDDLPVLKACKEVAQRVGFEVTGAGSGEEARELVRTHAPDLVLMDLKMPGGGLSLLEDIRSARPRSAVVIMTAFATVTSAVEAMRIGATDYLTKPFAMDELVTVLERAAQERSFELENQRIKGQLQVHSSETMIGNSPEMVKISRIIQKVATASHPVLIVGESGSGKETVARAIHANGPHSSRRFVMLECGQLSPSVLESELFGFVRSPLTGSSRSKEGALTLEDGGTLFLDQIGEMSPDLQTQLLRALQSKRVRPAGSDTDRPVTVRVLASSTKNLLSLVESGSFRRDLYYRLAVVSLRIPPLRERQDDIPLLGEHFLERLRRESGLKHRFSPEAIQMMRDYEWPGNVRELESAIERACSISSGPVLYGSDFPSQMQGFAAQNNGGLTRVVDERHQPQNGAPPPPRLVSIAELERDAILHTVRQLKGDKLMAAKLLGIGKTTLYRKLKEYGITDV